MDRLGNFQDAEELLIRAINIRQTVLGGAHTPVHYMCFKRMAPLNTNMMCVQRGIRWLGWP